MAREITPTCDLIFGYLKCDVPEDTIDIDFKIHMLRDIYTYKKDRNPQVNKCSPGGSATTPFTSLQRKMTEFIKQREAATHFNRFHQPQPEATVDKEKEYTLINITQSGQDNQWQPRKLV